MKKEVSVSHHNKLRKEDSDLSTFDLHVIAEATDNFSDTNKLGEGGFGPVYKVIWPYVSNQGFLFSSLNTFAYSR